MGEEATVFAEVRTVRGRRSRQGRAIVEVVVTDGTSPLNITFFNQPWREKQLSVGTEASFFGKLDVYRGKRQMTNPVVDVVGRAGLDERTGVIVPVYPQSGKAEVFTWQLRALVSDALAKAPARLRRPARRGDPRPEDLLGRGCAARDPPARIDGRARRGTQAPDLRRVPSHAGGSCRAQAGARGRAVGDPSRLSRAVAPAFVTGLPFGLTADQQRAIDEIAADLAGAAPMHRLLQGDVGSGKTVVAAAAADRRARRLPGALMAPTEVLAEQHYLGSLRLLDGLDVPASGSLLAQRPVRVALLTNRTTAAERRRISAGLDAGEIDILVGTHALLYGDAQFSRLGLAVIDEQHRFGVEQRALLRGKGDQPDVLVMTATPIPRTAAMLVYGDLDRSELRDAARAHAHRGDDRRAEPARPGRSVAELRRGRRGRRRTWCARWCKGQGRSQEQQGRGEGGDGGVRAAAGRGLRGLRRAAARADEVGGEGTVMAAFRAGDPGPRRTTVIGSASRVERDRHVVEDADRFGLRRSTSCAKVPGTRRVVTLVRRLTTPEGEQRLEAMAASPTVSSSPNATSTSRRG